MSDSSEVILCGHISSFCRRICMWGHHRAGQASFSDFCVCEVFIRLGTLGVLARKHYTRSAILRFVRDANLFQDVVVDVQVVVGAKDISFCKRVLCRIFVTHLLY